MKKIIIVLAILSIAILIYLIPPKIELDKNQTEELLIKITNFNNDNKRVSYKYNFRENILEEKDEFTLKVKKYYLSKNKYELNFYVTKKTFELQKENIIKKKEIKFYQGYCRTVMPVLFLNDKKIKNECEDNIIKKDEMIFIDFKD